MNINRGLSIALLALLAQLASAGASVTCTRIEKLPGVSDANKLKLFEEYLLSNRTTQRLSLKKLDHRFLVSFPTDQDCKRIRCYYRILEESGGTIRERFSFRGTGVIFLFLTSSPLIDDFNDYFYTMALEIYRQTYLLIDLPTTGSTILVRPNDTQDIKYPSC